MKSSMPPGLALPGVNVEAAKGIYDDDNTHQNYREWSIKLRQPILDGGKAWSETTRQTERVNSARNRVADTANTIGLQVVQAYLEGAEGAHGCRYRAQEPQDHQGNCRARRQACKGRRSDEGGS
ncbi:MAG: TolC family protein [Nitratireductor sp.]